MSIQKPTNKKAYEMPRYYVINYNVNDIIVILLGSQKWYLHKPLATLLYYYHFHDHTIQFKI